MNKTATIPTGTPLAGMQSRDFTIDMLRFVGVSLILLAHIVPPDALFQLRSFDVPLMIFVSGLSYSGRQITDYAGFVRKRLGRLLVPLYLFLAVYLTIMYLLSQAGAVEWFGTKKVVGTLLLRLKPSIGYVWIFRIFLIVMLTTPALLRLERLVKRDGAFALLLAGLLGLQYLLVAWLKPLKLGFLVNDWLLYVVAYAIPFLAGVRMRYADRHRSAMLGGLFVAAMVCAACIMAQTKGTWLRMQPYKYPPQVYFLLWGTAVSVVLWSLRDSWSRLLSCRLVRFIGQNTIWLYLWHIPFVPPIKHSMAHCWWGWRYLTIYAIALCGCYLQYRIVGMLEKRSDSQFLKYLKG